MLLIYDIITHSTSKLQVRKHLTHDFNVSVVIIDDNISENVARNIKI